MFALLATWFLLALSPVVPSPASSIAPASPEPAIVPLRPSWRSRLSSPTPGAFPPPRSYEAGYSITWGGIQAARADAQISSPPDAMQIRTRVNANTIGTARLLFKLDATHLSVVDRRTLRPQYLEQTERGSRKNVAGRVDFDAEGATRRSRDLTKPEDAPDANAKPKRFRYPDLFDMEGVLLYLRSLPLADGDERTLLLMTAGNPYLVTIKVVGHNRVSVGAGDYPAIECSLKLEKVGKNGELEPRKGFKSAHAWLSDDADRLLVKAQSEVFVGSVSLELEKVTFAGNAHRPPG